MTKITRLTPDDRENLVAYLDGELDDASTQKIEKTLAVSSVARHEVEMLEQTWELLEELPREKASADFTQRTMATVKVVDVKSNDRAKHWLTRARKGLILSGWLTAITVSAVVGFAATRFWIPNETDILVNDLPIIENLDAYHDVDSIEFLKEMHRHGVMNE